MTRSKKLFTTIHDKIIKLIHTEMWYKYEYRMLYVLVKGKNLLLSFFFFTEGHVLFITVLALLFFFLPLIW